jgi:hypothetical protein
MAEMTFQNALKAMRIAQESGQTEKAIRMAQIAKQLEGENKSIGALPFANRAIAELAGAPADIIRGGLEKIPNVKLADPFLGRKSIESGMRSIGIKLPEEGQQPKAVGEHVGRTVGEVSSLLIPSTAVIKSIKGISTAGRVSQNIYQSMVKHPYLTMASELGGGVGAGVGRAAGEQNFPDSPIGRTTAEVVGGFGGALTPTALVNTPKQLLFRGGKTLLQKMTLPFTESGAKYRAGKYLKNQVASPQKTVKALGEATISDLPPVVAAGEKRLVALYKSMIGQSPVTDADTIETLSKSIIKLEGEMRKLGYGSPELLTEITRKRVAAIELNIDRRVMGAMDKATERLNAIPVAERRVAESRIVRSELEKVMATEWDKNKALWKQVPKDIEIGFEETRIAYQQMFDDLPQAQKVDIPPELKSSPIIKNEKLRITNLKEMQGLRSKLLETSRIAGSNKEWNKARIANDMADAILLDMETSASASDISSFKTALASTKHFKTRFESGITGKILGRGRDAAPSIDPSLTLDVSVGRMKQRGAVGIDKVAVTPEARQATSRYLARSFTEHASPKGTIDPHKAQRWIKNNEAILDQFPDLRKQLSDATGAQELADTTRIAMNTRLKALQDPKVSMSAEFLNTKSMGTAIDNIFKSKTPIRLTREMVRQARKDTTGNALEGLKGGFVDDILDKSLAGPFNELGEKTLSGRTMLNYLKRNDKTLREVFDNETITRMRRIGMELAKIEGFERTPKFTGKIEDEMKDLASSALRLFSRVGGAQFGRWVASATGGGTVQTPGIFSDRFKSFANFLNRDRAFQLIHDAIISPDPKLLRSLMQPIDKPKLAKKNLILLNKTINAWLIGSGKRVMDDIEKEEQGQ